MDKKYRTTVRMRFRIPPGQRKPHGAHHLDVEPGQEIVLGPEDAGLNIETLVRLGYLVPVEEENNNG